MGGHPRSSYSMAFTSDEIDAKAPEVVVDQEKQAAVTWDAETEKKLRWKCDRNVLPCITLLFFLSFLDRTNIGKLWTKHRMA